VKVLKRFGSRGLYGLAAVVPLAAVLSWYCYDYLTPSNFNLGINIETLYEHGLTLNRYLTMFGIQVVITSFSALRWRMQVRENGKAGRLLMVSMCVASFTLGALMGYENALVQYQFL
jgi:hypothetical protein